MVNRSSLDQNLLQACLHSCHSWLSVWHRLPAKHVSFVPGPSKDPIKLAMLLKVQAYCLKSPYATPCHILVQLDCPWLLPVRFPLDIPVSRQ
jgi:hypothetical protein